MSEYVPKTIVALAAVCVFTICGCCLMAIGRAQPAAPPQPKAETPKDGVIYVWPLPAQGHQTMVILNVIDGQTVDAAYLVPVRLRLKGYDAKAGKEATEALEKLLSRQLVTAQLWGPDEKTGAMLADFWVPTDKDKGEWVSEGMVKGGHGTPQRR